MRPQQKFHLIAIVSICVVITAIYTLMQPEPKPVPTAADRANGDRAIEIYSATWGDNCAKYIDQELAVRATMPPAKDEKGQLIEPPKLAKATHDNALMAVGNACNGKLSCQLAPNSENMGFEPMASCAKELVLSYRCFSYDRLWTQTIVQGKPLTIDCNDKTVSDKAATPAAK